MATDALNFARNFGTNQTQAPASNQEKPPRPTSYLWMNFGYSLQTVRPDGTENFKFISFPKGLALDTMEKAQPGRTEDYNKTQAASNALLQQYIDQGLKVMKRGERYYGVIEFELYHVGEKPEAPADEENEYVRKIEFVVSE